MPLPSLKHQKNWLLDSWDEWMGRHGVKICAQNPLLFFLIKSVLIVFFWGGGCLTERWWMVWAHGRVISLCDGFVSYISFLPHGSSVAGGKLLSNTFPETNDFAPKNGWLEEDCFLRGSAYFQVRTVSFRECKNPYKWSYSPTCSLWLGLKRDQRW